jgi:U3 small nucleolar RNA-associated protein 25
VAEIVDTESGAAETVQRDKKANWGFQGIVQSDEDDIQDEYDAPSGDAPGDTINNGNGCFDAETSWLVLHI